MLHSGQLTVTVPSLLLIEFPRTYVWDETICYRSDDETSEDEGEDDENAGDDDDEEEEETETEEEDGEDADKQLEPSKAAQIKKL